MDLMRKSSIVVILFFLFTVCVFPQADSIPYYPFTTDGCSIFPDGNWVHCCTIHDKIYWMGGSYEDRIRADFKLKQCISNIGTELRWRMLGWTMYWGVRAGGGGWLPTPFRWGYGWKFPRTGP